mgnify:FL=1
MMFITENQQDWLDAAVGDSDRDDFVGSDLAQKLREQGVDAEAAYDLDLVPPGDPDDPDEPANEELVLLNPETEQGRQFNHISKIVHDYHWSLNEYKNADHSVYSSARFREQMSNTPRELYTTDMRYMDTARNRSDADVNKFGIEFGGNLNYNMMSGLINWAKIDDMPAEVALATAALLEEYEQLPNWTWSGTSRMLRSLGTDAFTYIGGIGGIKIIQQLLRTGGTQAVKNRLMKVALRGAGLSALGAEGSAYAAFGEYMAQRLKHGKIDEANPFNPDWATVATVGGFGFGMGALAGGAAMVPQAARAVKAVATDTVGPVVRDLFDTAGQSRSTLTSGVGPVPATAADEVSAPAPVFFSAVSNAVDALPMEKGSAQQMRAMIAKSEGVKPEEMAWTGLDDFLKGKKSVTKAEVQEHMQANEVKIEEVTLPRKRDVGIKSSEDYRAELEEMSDERLAQEAVNEFGFDLEEVLTDITGGDHQDYITDLVAAFSETLGGRGLDDAGRLEDRTKFGEYTLPGGENYREVLLTLPKVSGATISDTELARLNELTDKRIADSLDGLTDAERDEYITLVGKREDRGQFRTPHFDEPNVLAHMRLNDRTGPDGEKILFIEEIQSDWHQTGRKQGYKVPVPTMDEPTQARFDQFKKYRSLYYDARLGKSEAITGGDPGLTKEYEALEKDFEQYFGNVGQVPDAPLKKTWHEMSFRRVARMAAEEGYDAIAWTPGKVQAERYNLSKQISEIHLSGTNFKAFGLNGEEVIARTGVTPDDLPELIGKEAADRLLSEKPKNGLRSLTGEQLEVGGEGMKGFYDKILKNYAAKWGKKFGSKVGVTKIARDYPEMADDIKLLDDLGVEATGSPHHEVWSMPVTKKMRDSVLKKGVPLFGAAGVAGGAATSDTSESPDI